MDASIEANQASPSFTYNVANRNDGGTSPDIIYPILRDHGCVSVEEFPINYMSAIAWNPTIEAQRKALKTRLTNVGIAYVDGVVSSVLSDSLTEVKEYLYSDKMVLNVIGWADWDWMENEEGEDVIVRARRVSDSGGWHGMTIVGYDDTIECDINGNGVIEDAEKGALILANSHGTSFGTNGFAYIMYDALNLVSEVKHKDDNSKPWDYQLNGVRYQVFGDTTGGAQQFRAIYVNKYNPTIIAEVGLNTDARCEVGFSYLQRNLSTGKVNGKNSEDGLFNSNVAAEYSYNSFVLFDVSYVCTGIRYKSKTRETFEGSYQIEFTITDETFTGNGYNGNTDGVRNVTFKLTDIDGNIILNTKTCPNVLENSSYTFTSEGICSIGDVNYDGSITSMDAMLVLQYVNGITDFNKTQQILADYNNDGIIDSNDANAILTYISEN